MKFLVKKNEANVETEASRKSVERIRNKIDTALHNNRPAPLIPKAIFNTVEQYDFFVLWKSATEKLKIHRTIKPSRSEDDDKDESTNENLFYKMRKIRRIIFLLFSEPSSSILSVLFLIILTLFIFLSLILMIMSTLPICSYTPSSCNFCDDSSNWILEGENTDSILCVCPPEALRYITLVQDYCLYYLTFEFSIRVLCFEPHPDKFSKQTKFYRKVSSYFYNWLLYLFCISNVVDALSIFPLYIQFSAGRSLLALRLFNVLRIFRVFRLRSIPCVSKFINSVLKVVEKSLSVLSFLMVFLLFGSIFFGSLIYYFEMGVWMYTTSTDPPSFMYMRKSVDGVSMEVSPFNSIADACWWFVVTTTTLGYGDLYPTSSLGRLVAVISSVIGLFVIAFPLSVFTSYWSQDAHVDHETKESEGLSQSTLEMSMGYDSSDNKYIKDDVSNDKLGNNTKKKNEEVAGNEELQIQYSKSDSDAILHHLAIINKAQKDICESQKEISCILRQRRCRKVVVQDPSMKGI